MGVINIKNKLEDIMSDKNIQSLANRPNHQLTVGLTNLNEREIWTKGPASLNDSSNLIYEIGSITKTLTGLLLAIGEEEGIWDKTDSLAKHLPELSTSSFAQQTTLLQLVTHTSGLPAIAGNFKLTITDKLNPYANYNENHLVEAVLAEKPNSKNKHRYSNYGFGLLGWLLSKRLGKTYNEALSDHIFKALGMNNSGVGIENKLLLPVYTSKNKAIQHWDFLDTTAGAGAVQSTISDMLNYIEAHLEDSDHSLNSALAECRKEHYAIFPSKGVGIGYAWMFYNERDGSKSYWHNGGTYGSSSFTIFNRHKKIGLVILSNQGANIRSQIPLIGTGKMNVDKLARILITSLF